MSIQLVKGVSLEALACTVPKKCVTLTEYAPNLVNEKSARQIENVSGFHSLRIADDQIKTSDLACESARQIISNLWGGGISNITALIFVTQTPDYILPATSHEMQNKLGLNQNILCIDINEGCSGFITGLYISSIIAANSGKKVLFCGADTKSRLASPNDRATRVIFGDAGFAAVVSPSEGENIAFNFFSDGSRANVIKAENGNFLSIDGAAVMAFTLSDVTKAIADFMKDLNVKNSEIDFFACHQANKLMLATMAKKLNIPPEKMPFTAGETGNTSAASIPLLLSNHNGAKSKVLCAGFGVGLAIGTCLADFSRTKFFDRRII